MYCLKSVDTYSELGGAILDGNGSELLFQKEDLLNVLKEHGFILFRNFNANMETFTQLVRDVSSRMSLDPAREFHSEVAQKVDAGYDAVGLHCENGNSPFWPDLAWFYCEKAAKEGSYTTLCDGYKVWEELDETTRSLFQSSNVVYDRVVGEKQWKNYVLHCNPGLNSIDAIELDDLTELISGVGLASFTQLDDNSIRYVFEVGAARPTLFDEKIAFANSLLGPSYNYEKPVISFVNGEEVSKETLNKIRDVSEKCTVEMLWQDGDIVIIDNTRYMHGRRKILDPDRKIFNALSYI